MNSDPEMEQVYKEVKEAIGSGNSLGCIMIDTEPIVVSDVISDLDYYYSDKHDYVNGNVSEDVPHCTLLYGLLRSGPQWEVLVNKLLQIKDGVPGRWFPEELVIDKVSFFYGQESDYVTIIALIKVTDDLLEGNNRLKRLWHTQDFPDYKPHITLAYVKASSPWEDYVRQLDTKLMGTSIKTIGINLGD